MDTLDIERAKSLALAVREELEKGDLDAFGRLLHRCWTELEQETKVDPCLAHGYGIARENGALGGKATGSGHSEFLVLYCPEDQQESLTEALLALGLQRWPLVLDDAGVQVMQLVPWSWSNPMSMMPWAQGAAMHDMSSLKSPNHGRAGGMADYQHL